MISVDDPVFRSYAYWSGILAVKTFLMAALTARQRFTKLVFANPEDAKFNSKAKVNLADPDVERVRRAHLNDLENILPFFTVGLLFCCTKPDPSTANLLFKLFTGARIAHTLVYAVFPIPQPSRVIAYVAGKAVTVYMALKVISHFA